MQGGVSVRFQFHHRAKASINAFGCAFAKGFAAPDTHDTPPNAACAAPKALPAAADGAFLL